MTTAAAVSRWVDLYRAAWESNLADDIRAVFTEDGVYRGRPQEEPWVGHPAIVAGWLDNQDAPGTWTFEWHPVAVEGDTAVVQGVTSYSVGGKVGVYDNLWVVRLADDGRAREFTDWWIGR
jgi:ketosteroid isomerase-like protein